MAARFPALCRGRKPSKRSSSSSSSSSSRSAKASLVSSTVAAAAGAFLLVLVVAPRTCHAVSPTSPTALAAGLAASASTGARVAPLNPQVSKPLYPPYALFPFCDDGIPTVPGTNELWFWEKCLNMVPLNDEQVVKKVPGCAPEQATVKLWETGAGKGQSSVLLSFATCAGGAEGSPPTWNGWQPDPLGATPLPTTAAVTDVAVGVAPGVYTHGGCSTTAVKSYSENWPTASGTGQGGGSYTSPILHHCLLKNLTAGVKYYYKIADAPQLPGTTTTGANPYFGSFTVPSPAFPLKIGVAGDAGQILNSTLSRDILLAQKPDVLMLTGDIAYADSGTGNPKQFNGIEGFSTPFQFFTEFGQKQADFGGRWDTFTRLWKALLSSVPTVTTIGNHEILEMEPNRTPFYAKEAKGKNAAGTSCKDFGCPMEFTTRQTAYNARFPGPTSAAELASGPSSRTLSTIVAADPATATSNAWSVREVANVATIITLNNYIFDDDFTTASAQFQWFKSVLSKVDRTRTPWLIVMWHNPWYATYAKHWREVECMRLTYEPLFKQYGVDVAINGHDHSYDRSFPTFNNAVDLACGTTHLTLGNAGADDLTLGYMDQVLGTESELGYYNIQYCNKDGTLNPSKPFWPKFYVPQQPNQYGPGGWCTVPVEQLCPTSQSSFSAFREQAYGVGVLELLSPTEARWSFISHRDPTKPSDEVIIKRSPEREAICGVSGTTPASAGGKAGDYARAVAAGLATPLTDAGAVASEGVLTISTAGRNASVDPRGTGAALEAAVRSAARGVAWKGSNVAYRLQQVRDAAAIALGKSTVNVTQAEYNVALAGGGRK